MGNIGAHVWTIIISLFLFLMALMIWFFGFLNLHDSLASDNLQDAVRTCAYLSSDNSARAERGAFVINKDKFNDYFQKIHIKQLHNETLQSSTGYKVFYMPDTSTYDASTNDHNVDTSQDGSVKGTATPEMARYNTNSNGSDYVTGSNNPHGYEAIRAIRVLVKMGHPGIIKQHYKVTSDGSEQTGTNESQLSKYGIFSATQVFQTDAKNANNDMSNDLTR